MLWYLAHLVGVFAFFALVFGAWKLMSHHTRRVFGFERVWPVAAGAVESTSEWGTVYINGRGLGTNTVRLLACQNGVVIQLARGLGGGFILLPWTSLRIFHYPPHGWLKRECRGVFAWPWEVFVYAHLAEFIDRHDSSRWRDGDVQHS